MCLSFHYLSRSPASRRFARSALKSSTISSTLVAFPTAAAGVTVPAGPVAPAAPAGDATAEAKPATETETATNK